MNESGGELTAELIEHLAGCPHCSLEAKANRDLNRLLEGLGDHEETKPLSVFRRGVETLAETQSIWEKIMLNIEKQVQGRPGLLAGAGLATALFLFLTLVPFSLTHTAGYQVSVSSEGVDEKAALDKVEQIMLRERVESYTVLVSSDGDSKHFAITSLPSQSVADELASALEETSDTNVVLRVEPVRKVISKPLLAQVISRVMANKRTPVKLKLDVGEMIFDCDGVIEAVNDMSLSDKEVESEINDRLTGMGLSSADFTVSSQTDVSDNTRTIRLTLASQSDSLHESQIEFTIGEASAIGSQYNEYAVRVKSGSEVETDSTGRRMIRGHSIVIKVSLGEDSD